LKTTLAQFDQQEELLFLHYPVMRSPIRTAKKTTR
jgi:hypothetical protein